jgi:hypothetical protein
LLEGSFHEVYDEIVADGERYLVAAAHEESADRTL